MTTDTSFGILTASSGHTDPNIMASLESVPTNDESNQTSATDSLLTNPNTLILNELLTDKETPWQVHNCKIIDKSVTQEQLLPFIYHYDALSEELKQLYPLTGDLLKQFQTPMSAQQAAELLGLDAALVPTPWMVKITGTLVMFCEWLQIALRLKFTNTAKDYDPIYTTTAAKAVEASMQDWHFYGDIFVLNKGNKPLIMTVDPDWIEIPKLPEYQLLPGEFGLATLALLEQNKSHITDLQEAINQRLV